MIKILLSILAILAICQGQLQIATDPTIAPFSFLDAAGAHAGFDIDFLAAVAQAADPPLEYALVSLAWADLFQQVQNGQVDAAISAITINDERRETWDFSVPYFLSAVVILAPEGTDIASAQDLQDKVVGVRSGTTGEAAVNGILGADNANILRYQTFDEVIQALASGAIAAYVDDRGVLQNYANNNPGYVVIEDSDAFPEEFFGVLLPKGSELKAVLDPAITAVLQNGGYAEIYSNWFGTAPDVDLLLLAGQEADPYDVFAGGEETEWNNEEWDWNIGDIAVV